ncbi:hypothetical protein ACTVOK_13605, partial [Serratia marcescens]
EQLRSRAAAYRTDAATLAEMGDKESSQRLNESANAFDELAANREAQPAALDVIARFKEWNTGFPVEKFKADYVIGWVLANYYAPPAPAVPEDYFGRLVEKARVSADKAMRKFPQPNYVLNKVAE